jgi:hypothetical protein
LFSGVIGSESAQIKAQGDIAEAQSYTMAAGLALLNKQYTETKRPAINHRLKRPINALPLIPFQIKDRRVSPAWLPDCC